MWTKVEKDSVYHFDKIELFIPLENENALTFLMPELRTLHKCEYNKLKVIIEFILFTNFSL